jgi:hypothetical protein
MVRPVPVSEKLEEVMENAPVIRIQTVRVRREFEERVNNWRLEAYFPLYITIPGIEEINWYQKITNTPQYHKNLAIFQYKNRNAPSSFRNDQRYKDVIKDLGTTWTGRFKVDWFAIYEQLASYSRSVSSLGENPSELSAGHPLIHLEGYVLSPQEQEQYDAWFDGAGQEAFIPLLMRLPGLKEYTRYRLIEVDPAGLKSIQLPERQIEYPPRLSVLTFNDISDFVNYEKSLELGAFNRALEGIFPFGLNYQWYVQYLLVKSWRK